LAREVDLRCGPCAAKTGAGFSADKNSDISPRQYPPRSTAFAELTSPRSRLSLYATNRQEVRYCIVKPDGKCPDCGKVTPPYGLTQPQKPNPAECMQKPHSSRSGGNMHVWDDHGMASLAAGIHAEAVITGPRALITIAARFAIISRVYHGCVLSSACPPFMRRYACCISRKPRLIQMIANCLLMSAGRTNRRRTQLWRHMSISSPFVCKRNYICPKFFIIPFVKILSKSMARYCVLSHHRSWAANVSTFPKYMDVFVSTLSARGVSHRLSNRLKLYVSGPISHVDAPLAPEGM
jgi:hypothetical protein